MKIKVSEATNIQLDWMVARCIHPDIKASALMANVLANQFNPSGDWMQGGPIIERERIALTAFLRADLVTQWRAVTFTSGTVPMYGETPLIAAMRCYVASKLGDEVEIPEELA